MKMELTEYSEMSTHKIQTRGNHPKERKRHSEHGENLKSRIYQLLISPRKSIERRFILWFENKQAEK